VHFDISTFIEKAKNIQLPQFIPKPYMGSSIMNGKIGVGKSLASCMAVCIHSAWLSD
jgi:hypothetical protein